MPYGYVAIEPSRDKSSKKDEPQDAKHLRKRELENPGTSLCDYVIVVELSQKFESDFLFPLSTCGQYCMIPAAAIFFTIVNSLSEAYLCGPNGGFWKNEKGHLRGWETAQLVYAGFWLEVRTPRAANSACRKSLVRCTPCQQQNAELCLDSWCRPFLVP